MRFHHYPLTLLAHSIETVICTNNLSYKIGFSMVLPFHGLVVNSSNPWATTQEQLQELYDCPFIGAVTTRTSLENQGWPEDQRQQYRFFDGRMLDGTWDNSVTPSTNLYSSINSLGYSPLKLDEYLKFAVAITRNSKPHDKKPFIISVTGSTPESVANCLRKITEISRVEGITFLMEVNLSCPNIPDRAPPAYNAEELGGYLQAIQAALKQNSEGERQVAVGIKIPPYTYSGQFDDLTKALLNSCIDSQSCPISFITATNTLGNCLVLEPGKLTFHASPRPD